MGLARVRLMVLAMGRLWYGVVRVVPCDGMAWLGLSSGVARLGLSRGQAGLGVACRVDGREGAGTECRVARQVLARLGVSVGVAQDGSVRAERGRRGVGSHLGRSARAWLVDWRDPAWEGTSIGEGCGGVVSRLGWLDVDWDVDSGGTGMACHLVREGSSRDGVSLGLVRHGLPLGAERAGWGGSSHG
jgi:hypothetical protein